MPRTAAAPSARYTPPARTRFRPSWHKAAGLAVIVTAAALVPHLPVQRLGIHRYGCHVWYLVGLVIAGTSLWRFGALDRTPPALTRRP